MTWITTAIVSIVLVEVVLRLPILGVLTQMNAVAKKALHVLSSKSISDHWKEKVMLAYAGSLFKNTMIIAGFLLLVVGIVIVMVVVFDYFGTDTKNFIVSWVGILFSCAVAFLYFKIKSRKSDSDSDYSFLDQLLHRLMLQYGGIAQISFDIDQMLVKNDTEPIAQQQHIFVSGLARAGTTVLMRRFHTTGLFTSLTYNDMPFVLAPNVWRQLSSLSKRKSQFKERAHGDNVLVSTDSPESLDEVFWRIFTKDEYLQNSYLTPHTPDPEVLQDFVKYVTAILVPELQNKSRYLSKNNNNILRLKAIQDAFPNALILIPFRDPLQQAFSLLKQHRRFSEIQKNSKFTLDYMGWLGHHEFGLDHRPFKFTDAGVSEYSDDSIEYWVQIWCQVYGWLEKSKPESAIFVCYEDLCTREETWKRLATLANIPLVHESDEPFKLSSHTLDGSIDPHLADEARRLYTRLTAEADQTLPNLPVTKTN